MAWLHGGCNEVGVESDSIPMIGVAWRGKSRDAFAGSRMAWAFHARLNKLAYEAALH
jgi:hypothetical protein